MPVSKCFFRNRKCRKAIRDNAPMDLDKSEFPALRRLQTKTVKFNAFKQKVENGHDY